MKRTFTPFAEQQSKRLFKPLSLLSLSVIIILLLLFSVNSLKANTQPVTKEALAWLFEGFEGLALNTQVPGWSGEFRVNTQHGDNSNNRYALRLASPPAVRVWATPDVSAGINPVIQFRYRVVNAASYPANATAATSFSIQVQIKLAGADDSTYETLETIGNGNHTVSNAYAQKTIPLPALYQNQNIVVRARVSRLTGDFWVDFDNVKIGTFSQAEFTILNRNSNPVNNASIAITGPVSITITTGANGKVMTVLPDGNYTYTISAAKYLTYHGGSFAVSGSDVEVSTPALIGRFNLTFQTRDQASEILGNVDINLTGTAYTYAGNEAVSGNIATNASGLVTLTLNDGEYNYTATKTNYAPRSGSLAMEGADKLENIVMQLMPLVTFTVVEESSDPEIDPVPLQGATIAIPGYTNLTTDALGKATIRLPMGSYSFTASKIGYFNEAGSFEIEDNNDLELPKIEMRISPPVFTLINPANGIFQYRITLTGQTSQNLNVTFSNTGAGILTIEPEDITIAGPDAGEFEITSPLSPIALAAGEQAIITVAFKPVSAGLKNAIVVIKANTGGEITEHTITLSGTGYNPVALPFSENFQEGNFNNWVVLNGTQVNQWHVGTAAADAGNLSAIISNNSGANNAYQTSGAISRVHFYMDFEIPEATGGKQPILGYNWKGMGEPTVDILRVYLVEPSTAVNSGSALTGHIFTHNSQAQWQTVNYNIPAQNQGKVQRLVFSWLNDGSLGTLPPAAVDNIYIGFLYDVQMAVAPEGTGNTTGSNPYRAGQIVTITATPAAGYVFTHWSAPEVVLADANAATTTFTMPGADVMITANFVPETPGINDQQYVYNGQEHLLTADPGSGFTIAWYNVQTGGEPVIPAGTFVGEYLYWAATVGSGGVESPRVPVKLAITPKELTVVGAQAQNKVYDGATAALVIGAMLEGVEVIDIDKVSLENHTTGIFESADAGENIPVSVVMTIMGDAAYNYILLQPQGLQADISRAPLTVTAQNISKIYGETDPAFSVLFNGFVEGEDESDLAGELFFERETGEDADDYLLTPSGLTSNNYEIAFVDGQFTITPRELTIGGSFTAQDKTADGTTIATIDATELVLLNTVANDDVALAGVVAEFAQSTPGNNIPVSLASAQLTGNKSVNYTISLTGAPVGSANIIAPTFTLTITITPAGGGSVTGGGNYEKGELVTLVATAATNFRFVKWEDEQGNELSPNAGYTYTMPAQNVAITALFEDETGIEETVLSGVRVYPNPAIDYAIVESAGTISRIVITDLAGKVVFHDVFNQGYVRINTSQFREGVYLVNIYTGQGVEVKKLLVK